MGPESKVLVFSTEGDTDKESFGQIVGDVNYFDHLNWCLVILNFIKNLIQIRIKSFLNLNFWKIKYKS